MSKATIPVKQVDLTRCKIPGGTATFFKTDELPQRRDQAMKAVTLTLPQRKLNRLVRASKVIAEEGDSIEDDFDGPEVVLTRQESEQLQEYTNLGIVSYLKSWTLEEPLPTTVDELLDNVPRKVFDALEAHVNQIIAASITDGFGLESVENEESPTGAFDA